MTNAEENGKHSESKEKRILFLVVEDTDSARQYIMFALKRLGYEAVEAETGEKALELMENNSVDGMLLDIALGPGISGITLMEKFRNSDRFKKTPIIAVTAFEKRVVGKIDSNSFNDYIPKPYLIKDLQKTLDKYFHSN